MFQFNFDISVAFDARKSLAMTVKKYEEKMRAERVTEELQLMKEKKADELFSRLHPVIDRLARLRVEGVNHTIGNILSVSTLPTEIRVNRKEQVEALLFSFDSLNREVQIVFEGSVQYHRTLRVEIGTGTEPILRDRRLPGEPFVSISWNNLPAIVNDSIDALLGVL